MMSTVVTVAKGKVLALLAVLLSFNSNNSPFGNPEGGEGGNQNSVWGYLTPKRTKELIARESAVALREAEVARREAELLAGAPGGVIPSPSPVLCPPCQAATTVETITGPIQTVIKEIVKEDSLAPPGWASPRIDEILDRELKVAEREREIGKREENINRREHDASRRESWIMEQLIALGTDNPSTYEEEYVYEPAGSKRKPAKQFKELPPLVISETQIETHIQTVTATETQFVPPPSSTRLVAFPTPEPVEVHSSTAIPRTTAVEIIREEIDDDEEEEEEEEQVVFRRKPGPRRPPPARWFNNW
ncbi:hypothetical protein VNI00_003351 [Paramarasmius palmivorus]|uniref:Uncharacterized protein n=1 Tax=Paramarasmius palmivorus TaxID=297713 RepID=A0AAW0DSE6_9AGAR